MMSKKMKHLFGLLLFMFMATTVLGQTKQNSKNLFSVTDSQIREFVKEVYQHEADMVFNDPQRMIDINDLLKNRFHIYPMTDGYRGKLKDIQKLSSVSLANFNNKNLKRDTNIDPGNFNPLKYNMDLYPSGSAVYSVGNSHIIFITPQNGYSNLKN